MADIRIERQGQRVYLVGDTFPVRDRIKSLGGHWDGDRRAWWVGVKKEAEARALAEELSRPVACATEGSAAAAATVGAKPDTPAGIVADMLQDQGRTREAERVRAGLSAQRPAGEVRLTGKGTYQGRSYYLGPRTKDGQRVLILGLPKADGSYFERWVPAGEVTVTKTYQPREVWDGRRYSGRTETRHQTLGGIADFIRRQERGRAAGEQACASCGKYTPLVHDLEDGLMKCRACCDMPAD